MLHDELPAVAVARPPTFASDMRYPIGNQDFRSLREKDYVYVDKTRHICRMITEGGQYLFLSRPRRFGKSLTVSTIKELHSGDRELFRGLWAYDNWGFAETEGSR